MKLSNNILPVITAGSLTGAILVILFIYLLHLYGIYKPTVLIHNPPYNLFVQDCNFDNGGQIRLVFKQYTAAQGYNYTTVEYVDVAGKLSAQPTVGIMINEDGMLWYKLQGRRYTGGLFMNYETKKCNFFSETSAGVKRLHGKIDINNY